jgi:hypothetical protein
VAYRILAFGLTGWAIILASTSLIRFARLEKVHFEQMAILAGHTMNGKT